MAVRVVDMISVHVALASHVNRRLVAELRIKPAASKPINAIIKPKMKTKNRTIKGPIE